MRTCHNLMADAVLHGGFRSTLHTHTLYVWPCTILQYVVCNAPVQLPSQTQIYGSRAQRVLLAGAHIVQSRWGKTCIRVPYAIQCARTLDLIKGREYNTRPREGTATSFKAWPFRMEMFRGFADNDANVTARNAHHLWRRRI